MSTKNTRIEREQYLFKEGDPSDTLYLIKSGRIALVKSNFSLDDGVQIAEKVSGEIVGDLSFF
ncbi:MAG: cyclic nucleotide-binding domain-containing protein [Bdellovibrionales bacterium]|nr:cyclic nucleotide-binding domain-containing protein [Bdellovibrionales bacterium]